MKRYMDWPLRICLVGCGAQKQPQPAPAGQLYTGALFRLSKLYASRKASYWYVVSAEHGLLEPERVIAPYDTKLPGRYAARERWARGVVDALMAKHPNRELHVTILAGNAYATPLELDLRRSPDVEVWRPLQGLGIGQQKRWLQLVLDGQESEAYELAKACRYHGRAQP